MTSNTPEDQVESSALQAATQVAAPQRLTIQNIAVDSEGRANRGEVVDCFVHAIEDALDDCYAVMNERGMGRFFSERHEQLDLRAIEIYRIKKVERLTGR
jgi:hypothetical protein